MAKRTPINIKMAQTPNPAVQAGSKKDDVSIHLTLDEMRAGIFPFMGTVDSKTILFIGSSSGFFFAGTKGEFLRLRDQVENGLYVYWKKQEARGESIGPFSTLGSRRILSAYKRLSDDGIVVILEGKEPGPYWTREEFLKTYGRFLEDDAFEIM